MKSDIKSAMIKIRNELLNYDDLYNGFVASIASALKEHWCCGLPFESEDVIARKVLDYMIGDDYEEKE